jgi:Flp pilus assembly protein TadG
VIAVVSSTVGASTIEAALGIAALVAVLVLCLAGITAVSMQVRCVDAAREAARLAARGDERSAADAARGVAPAGAEVWLRRDGAFIIAKVTARSYLLPGLAIGATGVAALEPSV